MNLSNDYASSLVLQAMIGLAFGLALVIQGRLLRLNITIVAAPPILFYVLLMLALADNLILRRYVEVFVLIFVNMTLVHTVVWSNRYRTRQKEEDR